MRHPCENCRRWISAKSVCAFYGYNVGDKILLKYGDLEVAHFITDEDVVCPLTDNIKQLQNKLDNETLAKDSVIRVFQLVAEENAALRNMMNRLVDAIFALNSAQDFSQVRKLNDSINVILAEWQKVK